MKCISKIKDEHGGMYVGLVIILIVMITSSAILFIGYETQVQAMEIKKTFKMEMNNLSAIIVEDTYNAIKKGNLDEYYEKLNSSISYKQYLLDKTIKNISSNLGLTKTTLGFSRINEKGKSDYTISNFTLHQVNEDKKIKYTIKANVKLHVKFNGKNIIGFNQDIEYTTYHVKNY